MAMRELYGPWRYGGRVGGLCVLALLACLPGRAEAQAQQSATRIGGVGRYFDPGRLGTVGSLRAIGGYSQVAYNAALQGNRPQLPLPVMSIGTAPGSRASTSRFRSGSLASISAGQLSMRSAASATGYASLRTPELASRTFDAFSGELGRTRSGAWQNRGLSIVARGFAGEDTDFAPTLGMVRQNMPRSRIAQRTDLMGQRSIIGGSAGSLSRALGPPVSGGRLASSARRFQPANQAIYRAAEVAVRADRERPAEEPLLPSENVSLNDIITARLQRRMDSYVQRGWSQFQARRYAEAYNSFSLADTIRSHAVEAKVGLVFSAIATSQYIAASNALMSMVEHNPDMLQRAVDMRAKYGNADDFTVQYQAFEDYMRASPSRSLGALYAFILWGRGDRSGAQINADRAAEGVPAGSPLVRFANLMREASAAPRS